MRAPSPSQGVVTCRQCQGHDLVDLGEIAPASVFAGQPLEPAWPGGRLYQCRHCHLGFRHPVHDDDTYTSLYAQAEGDVWLADRPRVDQTLVQQAVLEAPAPQRVLDVGCYTGALLCALGDSVSRFGVEASRAAGAVARAQGVTIVATRVADLADHEARYDAVTAVDVIEHLVRPDRFLALLAGCLAPGGRLVISTGSIDTPARQSAGGRFWYSHFPEHVSFISPAWASAVAPGLGLQLVRVQRFAYLQTSPWWRFRRAWRFQRRRWARRSAAHSAAVLHTLGEPGLFEDHVLLVFQRAGARSVT